jgi:CheY-like chemotaxis protein
VLLAEDVDINREIVQALLESTQIEIDCAVNGAEAVRKFKEAPGKYDVILMDLQMPEMDGYEATSQIRALKNPEAKAIKIIAMTANVFRDDIERCLEVGMDDHIGKPVDFQELIEKLQASIPRREEDDVCVTDALVKCVA